MFDFFIERRAMSSAHCFTDRHMVYVFGHRNKNYLESRFLTNQVCQALFSTKLSRRNKIREIILRNIFLVYLPRNRTTFLL